MVLMKLFYFEKRIIFVILVAEPNLLLKYCSNSSYIMSKFVNFQNLCEICSSKFMYLNDLEGN